MTTTQNIQERLKAAPYQRDEVVIALNNDFIGEVMEIVGLSYEEFNFSTNQHSDYFTISFEPKEFLNFAIKFGCRVVRGVLLETPDYKIDTYAVYFTDFFGRSNRIVVSIDSNGSGLFLN